jgi:hypothetical protein
MERAKLTNGNHLHVSALQVAVQLVGRSDHVLRAGILRFLIGVQPALLLVRLVLDLHRFGHGHVISLFFFFFFLALSCVSKG